MKQNILDMGNIPLDKKNGLSLKNTDKKKKGHFFS